VGPAVDAVDNQIDPLAHLVPGEALASTRPTIFSPEPSPWSAYWPTPRSSAMPLAATASFDQTWR